MNIKPAISFIRVDSDAELIASTAAIITSMTGNPVYPTPTPAIAAVSTAKSEFATALANAARGGTDLTAIKNARRGVLGVLLRELAAYVSVACKGNLVDLIGSGFPIQKTTRTPAGLLTAPDAPTLALGVLTGSVDASTTPVPNGSTYNWRVALPGNPPDIKVRVQTTAASNTFANLTPGQIYVVDVNVVGAAGPSDYSDSAQLMIV